MGINLLAATILLAAALFTGVAVAATPDSIGGVHECESAVQTVDVNVDEGIEADDLGVSEGQDTAGGDMAAAMTGGPDDGHGA